MKFEDISDGLNVSRSVEITEQLVSGFGSLVGDSAPVHFDDQFAVRQGFPCRIAHGLLVTALFSGLLGEELPGPETVINELKIKFRAPVKIGASITIKATVERAVPAVKAVALSLEVVDMSDKNLCVTGTAVCSYPA